MRKFILLTIVAGVGTAAVAIDQNKIYIDDSVNYESVDYDLSGLKWVELQEGDAPYTFKDYKLYIENVEPEKLSDHD